MRKLISLFAVVVLMLSLTGCVSTKKIRYFQGSDSLFVQAQRIMQQYEMRIKSADQLYIKLSCSEPSLLDVYRQSIIIGAASQSSSGITTSISGTGLGSINGFTVDNQGYIILPVLGRLKVSGLTTDECAELIEQTVREKGKIKDPEVKVQLLNARVAVVGAVRSPGVISLSSERNTIIDVLAQCGDIGDTGLRYKVQLFREVEGKREMYRLDLTKADVFQSPAYYVQQNDMIYVEPNKSKSIKSSPFYTFLGAGSSILALLTTCISLIFLIKKD